MRATLLLIPLLLSAACVSQPTDKSAALIDPRIAEGRFLADVHCAACHTFTARDQAKRSTAPPLYTLSQRYPISDLRAPLSQGIVVGHPEMPQFRFRPEDVDALIAYLDSIQVR
jgi:mono/diheme cytochrome c family protein